MHTSTYVVSLNNATVIDRSHYRIMKHTEPLPMCPTPIAGHAIHSNGKEHIHIVDAHSIQLVYIHLLYTFTNTHKATFVPSIIVRTSRQRSSELVGFGPDGELRDRGQTTFSLWLLCLSRCPMYHRARMSCVMWICAVQIQPYARRGAGRQAMGPHCQMCLC